MNVDRGGSIETGYADWVRDVIRRWGSTSRNGRYPQPAAIVSRPLDPGPARVPAGVEFINGATLLLSNDLQELKVTTPKYKASIIRSVLTWATVVAVGVPIGADTAAPDVDPRQPSAASSATASSAPASSATVSPAVRRVPHKTQTSSARLLLPFFESNFTDVDGIETLFSVRNQDTSPVDIVIRYYEVNRPTTPQLVEEITLPPKRTSTHVIRLKNVVRDDDGVARGYAIIEADRPVITGDYFRVNDSENFAAGDRLVNADISSAHYALCQRLTSRAFQGGSFSGGTVFTIFVEDDQPIPIDSPEAIVSYRVYNEAGTLLFPGQIFRDALTFEVRAEDLGVLNLEVPNFAVIEFEFNSDINFIPKFGHIWARMEGGGRVSVGLNASCDDAAPNPN